SVTLRTQVCGQLGNGRALEQRRHRNVLPEFLANPSHQTYGQQRMAPEKEEVVIDADGMNVQDLFPDLYQLLFEDVSRWPKGASSLALGRIRSGKSLAIDLSIG